MEQANDVIYPDLKLSEIHAGRFCSVRLPRSVPFFDCRIVDEDIRNVRTPWGTVLWSAERAAAALGMVTETCKYGHQRRLMGVQFYFDAREIEKNRGEVARIVQDLRNDLAKVWREYRWCKRHPSRNGGGPAAFRPVFVELANFGAGVYGDDREMVVGQFRGSCRTRRDRP